MVIPTPAIPIIHTNMLDVSTQLTLQTWMSAAFPTGAFSCSHGMESAIADGRIHNAQSCEDWITGIMQYGSGWNDAVFTTNAYSNSTSKESLESINALALALCTGAERRRETTQLGLAFAKAAAIESKLSVLSLIDQDICLPIAVGAQGALSNIPVNVLLPASLQASSSNLVWICTRLIPLGQTQALQIISSLQHVLVSTAKKALDSTLDDLGSCALLADLASIEHEQLHSRICIT